MDSLVRSTPASPTTRTFRNRIFATGIAVLLCIALLACGSEQDSETTDTAAREPAATEPAEIPQPPPEALTEEKPAPSPEETAAGERSRQMDSADHGVGYNDTVWAPGKEEKLMLGLDKGLYEPYQASVVQRAQEALQNAGIYDGPITGVIDQQTMEAIGKFQEQNGLRVSGVPTPRTREELFGGDERDEAAQARS